MTRGPFAAAPILAISLTLLWSFGHLSAAGSGSQSFERVLAKSNGVAPPPYRATRRLEGGIVDSDKRGWLEAATSYQPGRGFTYEVVREGGSDYVRNKILRKMLETEQDLITAGKRLHASFDDRNYEFEDGGLTESGLVQILLKPAKKSDGLVTGSVFVDPTTGFMTKIHGRLVKNPSFWLRDVDVTWRYASINGYNVPVEMKSSGRVRIFGRSNFTMTYDYESIGGQPMNSRALKASLQERDH